MKLVRAASLALLFAAACGGKSKPAATEPTGPAGGGDGEASCCCDYIKEEGDPAGDDWSENQTYEMMPDQSCTDLSGQCVDAAQCAAGGDGGEAAPEG